MEQVVEPVSDPGRRVAAEPGRRVAPGGWRRAIVGVGLGLLAGTALAAVAPRDRPRRDRDRTLRRPSGG